MRRRRALALAGIALLVGAGAGFGLVRLWPPEVPAEPAPPAFIDTVLYRVGIDRLPLPEGTRRGSLDRVGDRLLLANNDGHLYIADQPAAGAAALDWQRLPLSVPTDLAVFEPRYSWWWSLGVRDIFVAESADGADLYVLHSVYLAADDCIVTRISRMRDFLEPPGDRAWGTLFETAPCLPIEASIDRIGGRIAVHDGAVIAAIGTWEADPVPGDTADPALNSAQRWDLPFGKTMRIDLETGAVTYLSAGHRNPQGLHVTAGGAIWITDHGPRGGDELDRIHEGGNYGWPVVTYGTAYGSFSWPPTGVRGTHDDFVRPVYAWTPSVGISQLAVLEDPAFAWWQGDMLVTSLNGGTVWRLRLEEDRVIYAEPMVLGTRLRDMAVAPGTVYILGDEETLFVLRPEFARDDRR